MPKHKLSKNEVGIGIVLDVEERFYNRKMSPHMRQIFDDRLTIYWARGETTTEPSSYVEKLAEKEEEND